MPLNAELRAFLLTLGHIEAGGVTEVCVFQGGKKPTHIGYFEDPEKAAKAIETHDGRGNVFVTLNPARRDLLARANNHLLEGTFKNPSERTKDTEIYRDSWFPIDIDPDRPSGISSTDEEKREALEVAKVARDRLLSIGVPASAMMTCDSGNGAYVLIRTPDCEVTGEHIERKKTFLNFIADKFDTERVKIDRTVYNPARLIGALGAMKVKGESIPERPHRRSAVRTIAGEQFDPTKEQRCEPFDLYALARKILPPAEEKKTTNRPANKKSAGGDYSGFDARKIAHLLTNHKPTDRGFDYYDCPNCSNAQKLWVRAADGKYGCYEPMSVCDWRKLRDKLRELATEAGIEVEERESGAKEPQAKTDVETVLGRIVTAQTILNTEYPEPKWAVKGLIPEGVTFIAGPPKLGKSIWVLNIAVAVAEGGKALSLFDVDQGSVLYLALEDGPRRIQDRLRKLTKGQVSDRLEVVTEWPRVNQGGLEAIEAWIERHGDARLLIVDTLKMLRPLATGRDRNAYDADYEAIQPLTKLASQRVALVIVHHTRKALADDPLATVSGSYGLTGAADGVLVLARSRNKSNATLSVIGRDVEEQELALEFKPNLCLWSVLGKADEVRRSDERQAVLDLLHQTGEALSPAKIAELLDKTPGAIRTLVFKMKGDGQIKLFGSKYQLPDFVEPEPTKIRKSKKAKNVTALPATNSTGNAPISNDDNDLDAERYRVTDVAPTDVTPENSAQEVEAYSASKTGNAVTGAAQPLKSKDIHALPAKNITGNTGNGKDRGRPLVDTGPEWEQSVDPRGKDGEPMPF